MGNKMNKITRFVLSQTLLLLASLASLIYGWEMTPKHWPVLIVYGLTTTVGLLALQVWIGHGKTWETK